MKEARNIKLMEWCNGQNYTYSPDSTLLAVVAAGPGGGGGGLELSGLYNLVNVSDQEILYQGEVYGTIRCLSFSTKIYQLLIGTEHEYVVLDLETKDVVFSTDSPVSWAEDNICLVDEHGDIVYNNRSEAEGGS